MISPIPIIENGASFTSFQFYTVFLPRVAEYYQTAGREHPAEFSLCVDSGLETLTNKYRIDPVTLPLLIGLGEQLKRYHGGTPLKLQLINTPGTIRVLGFLYRADFFHLVGSEKQNNTVIKGRNIFDFHEGYLGGFLRNQQRQEHAVREYSLHTDDVASSIAEIEDERQKRNDLVQHYTNKVQKHFFSLIYENIFIGDFADQYVEILAELITNGVLHSKSNVYALMFSDRYSTEFSISDNGIGLSESLNSKTDYWYFDKEELDRNVEKLWPAEFPQGIRKSVLGIFQALYFSMLKDRDGLFDLICNVLIDSGGYVRIHNESVQIILSSRLLETVVQLHELRVSISELHNKKVYFQPGHENYITEEDYKKEMSSLSTKAMGVFLIFVKRVIKNYSVDVKYSSLRIFQVRFRGVHIEVKIPNKVQE